MLSALSPPNAIPGVLAFRPRKCLLDDYAFFEGTSGVA